MLLARQRPPEHQDVLLGPVLHVVNPAQALLHPEVPPFGLGHEMSLGDQLGQVLGQHHVAVLVLIIVILVTVVDFLVGHGGKTTCRTFVTKFLGHLNCQLSSMEKFTSKNKLMKLQIF